MDLFLLFCLVCFAAFLLLVAELVERHEAKKMCRCGHLRKKHNTLLECSHKAQVAGYWFRCACKDYKQASKEPVT